MKHGMRDIHRPHVDIADREKKALGSVHNIKGERYEVVRGKLILLDEAAVTLSDCSR